MRWLLGICLVVLLAVPASAGTRFDIGAFEIPDAGPCTINSISVNNTTFTGGSTSGTLVGTMNIVDSGTCAAPTWSITSTGSDHASTACNASSGTDFQAVGSSLQLNATLATGTYADICFTATISGATGSPYTQAVTITGTGCTIIGVSLSGTTFTGGLGAGTVIGTMGASTIGICASPVWSITSTGSDHSSTACSASSGTNFQAVGTNLETNAVLVAGSYPNVCYTSTIAGATGSPWTQAVTLTGIGAVGPVKGGKVRGGLWH